MCDYVSPQSLFELSLFSIATHFTSSNVYERVVDIDELQLPKSLAHFVLLKSQFLVDFKRIHGSSLKSDFKIDGCRFGLCSFCFFQQVDKVTKKIKFNCQCFNCRWFKFSYFDKKEIAKRRRLKTLRPRNRKYCVKRISPRMMMCFWRNEVFGFCSSSLPMFLSNSMTALK
jgi:hypothetical protein